jgi:hypothetical protein
MVIQYFEFEEFADRILVDGQINESVINPLISKRCIGYHGNPAFTPLAWAVREQQIELVRYLLDHGSNDIEDAVYNAAWFGDANMVDYLHTRYGANIHHPGLMVIAASSRRGFEVVKYLHTHGVSLTAVNHQNTTPVFGATLCKFWHIVDYLYTHGVRLNAEELKYVNENKYPIRLPEHIQAYHKNISV